MEVKNGKFLPRKLMMLHTQKQFFFFISNKHVETVVKGGGRGHLNITLYLDFFLIMETLLESHRNEIRENMRSSCPFSSRATLFCVLPPISGPESCQISPFSSYRILLMFPPLESNATYEQRASITDITIFKRLLI